jgi:hypothetical protein
VDCEEASRDWQVSGCGTCLGEIGNDGKKWPKVKESERNITVFISKMP